MNKLSALIRDYNSAFFFIPAGIFFIVFGVIAFVINTNNRNYLPVDANVVNVRMTAEEYTDVDGEFHAATYDVTVKYTVDGKEYTATLDDISKYKVGDKMKIYYNPDDPGKITQTKSLILPTAFILGGIASLVGGTIYAVNVAKRNKKMKEQERNW